MKIQTTKSMTWLLLLMHLAFESVSCVSIDSQPADSHKSDRPLPIAESDRRRTALEIERKKESLDLSKPADKNSYVVQVLKSDVDWYAGSKNGFLALGNTSRDYFHKINLSLVCEKDSFVPRPLRGRTIQWRITDQITGSGQTDLKGEVNISFRAAEPNPYNRIILKTDRSSYELPLAGYLQVEGTKEECGGM